MTEGVQKGVERLRLKGAQGGVERTTPIKGTARSEAFQDLEAAKRKLKSLLLL